MRMHAIINRRAGSALALDVEDLGCKLVSQIQSQGHCIEAGLSDPGSIEQDSAAAVALKPDVLIAGGGDGTVRCAAKHSIGTETSLSILPLGTLNRIARDLHVPLDPEGAIAGFTGYDFRLIDAAEVNGRIFLCNSLLGLPPLISEDRQNLRGAGLAQRISGYFEVLQTIVAARKRIEVTIDSETTIRRLRIMSLAVSNNL